MFLVLVNERCYDSNLAKRLTNFLHLGRGPNLLLGAVTPVLPVGSVVPEQYMLVCSPWEVASAGIDYVSLENFGVRSVLW